MRGGRARRTGLAVALALPLGACSLLDLFRTPDSAKIASAANDYWYWSERYTEKCGGEHAPAACDAAYAALLRTKADIEKANDALKRGGKLPLQMSRVRSDLRELKTAVGRL